MTVEQLRKVLRDQPFEPFTLRTADGKRFAVKHPEAIAISPVGRTIILMTPDGAHEIIDLLLTASIHIGNGRAKRSRRSGS